MARTIGFTPRDAARVRFGRSCLWEVLTSFRALREPANHSVHLPWVRQVGPRVEELLGAGARPEVRAAFGLLGTLVGSGIRGDYAPDLLTPPPTSKEPSIETELVDLASTSPEVVRQQLTHLADRWTPSVQAMYDDPGVHLGVLADVIDRYWHAALAPVWTRITALAEAEVFSRGQQQTSDGTGTMLNDLHERVQWDGTSLKVSGTTCLGRNELEGGGLCLVPSVFVWPGVLVVADERTAQLAYPCTGVGTLWEGNLETPRSIEQVLGRSKTKLLVSLRTPASTTEAASRVELSVSAASEHLAALRAAGLVDSRRSGRAVLHLRTAVAEALLAGRDTV